MASGGTVQSTDVVSAIGPLGETSGLGSPPFTNHEFEIVGVTKRTIFSSW